MELLVDQCTAYGKCVEICPTQVIMQSDRGITVGNTSLPWFPVICDLCGGEPACTKICPTGAVFVDERLKVA